MTLTRRCKERREPRELVVLTERVLKMLNASGRQIVLIDGLMTCHRLVTPFSDSSVNCESRLLILSTVVYEYDSGSEGLDSCRYAGLHSNLCFCLAAVV